MGGKQAITFLLLTAWSLRGSYRLFSQPKNPFKNDTPRMFKGKVITLANVGILSPQKPPEHLVDSVSNTYNGYGKSFFEGKQETIKTVKDFFFSQFVQKIPCKVSIIHALEAQYGVFSKRKSLDNYEENQVFELNDRAVDQFKKEKRFACYKQLCTDTYINAGCMFGHLRFMSLYRKRSFKYLRTQKLYGINIDGNGYISDDRYFLFAHKLPDDFKPLSTYLKNKKSFEKFVPIKAFKEILILCEGLGAGGAQKLHAGNLFVNPKEKDPKKRFIVLISTGQPDTIEPLQFFNADWNEENSSKSIYLWSVVKGLYNLYKEFTDKKYREEIKCFVETKKRFQGASNYGKLKALFYENKNKKSYLSSVFNGLYESGKGITKKSHKKRKTGL